MPKAHIDVKVTMEMSLQEARNLAAVLGRQRATTSRTGEMYNTLMDALEELDRHPPTKGVE